MKPPPPKPHVLLGARQDTIHKDVGRGRAANTVRIERELRAEEPKPFSIDKPTMADAVALAAVAFFAFGILGLAFWKLMELLS